MKGRRTGRGRGDRGFMLLEVLIAFVIATLAISVIVAAAGSSLRGSRTAALYQQATVRARSRLDFVTNAGPPVPGEREGDDGGGFRWHERVNPMMSDAGERADGSLTLYGISVWITWNDGSEARSVRLDTARVGPPPPAP